MSRPLPFRASPRRRIASGPPQISPRGLMIDASTMPGVQLLSGSCPIPISRKGPVRNGLAPAVEATTRGATGRFTLTLGARSGN
jgi:hypothetical protein